MQEIGQTQNQRLYNNFKRQLTQAIDEIHVSPRSSWKRVKKQVVDKCMDYLHEKVENDSLSEASFSSDYDKDKETLTINLQCTLHTPLETVTAPIPIPEGANAEEFEKAIVESFEEFCKENAE